MHMLQTFIITLREGVEASLVIAIAIAYLKKTGRIDLLSTVYRAVAVAVIACFVGAWIFTLLNINAEAFGAWTLLVSAGFVLSMVIWMNRHGKHMKSEIESGLKLGEGGTGGKWGVFAFVFLMIFREGVETVLLLAALRLNTDGIMEAVGIVLGLGMAVLFGLSFIRGTIRVNLRQFFQITTWILMVVVAQLTITGLHELSENEFLPSSRAEMALIGPIVKNDVFFFITILALAGTLMLLEYSKRRAPKADGLEGAARRKAVWTARREKMWMVASCAASGIFILAITAEFIYAKQTSELTPATPVTLTDDLVRIPLATVADGNLHRYAINSNGINVRFIVVQKPDKSFATAFDACTICGNAGYYQKGVEVICRNCASAIVKSTIGIPGGCNPIPLKARVEGETLIIDASALDPGVKIFQKPGKST